MDNYQRALAGLVPEWILQDSPDALAAYVRLLDKSDPARANAVRSAIAGPPRIVPGIGLQHHPLVEAGPLAEQATLPPSLESVKGPASAWKYYSQRAKQDLGTTTEGIQNLLQGRPLGALQTGLGALSWISEPIQSAFDILLAKPAGEIASALGASPRLRGATEETASTAPWFLLGRPFIEPKALAGEAFGLPRMLGELEEPATKVAATEPKGKSWLQTAWETALTAPGKIPTPTLFGIREALKADTIGEAIARAFVPGSERSPWTARQMFFNLRRDWRLGQAKADELRDALKEATPEHLFEARDILTGKKEFAEASETAQNILTKLTEMSQIPKLSAKRKAAFEESFIKKVGQLVESLPDEVRQGMAGLKFDTPKEAWQAVQRLASAPELDARFRTQAQTVLNAWKTLPQDVMKAYRNTVMDYLKQRITSNSQWFSTYQKPGTYYSEWLGGYVPTGIHDAIEELRYIPRTASTWWGRFFMPPWRFAHVLGRIPTQFRNLYGNFILNDVIGEHPLPWYTPTGLKQYVTAFTKYINHYMRDKPDPLVKQFEDLTGIKGSSWTAAEVFPRGREVPFLGDVRSLPDLLQKVFKITTLPYEKLWDLFETGSKLAKFEWSLKKGMKPLEAAMDAVRATFDYDDVTRMTKMLREYVTPFPTFRVKATTEFYRTLVKQPWRALKYLVIPAAAAEYALSKQNLTDKDWETYKQALPKYVSDGWLLPLPWKDEKGRLQIVPLDWIVPFWGDVIQSVHNLKTAGPLAPLAATGVHPIYTLPATIIRGEDENGNRIWYDWDSPTTKIAKSLGYMFSQVAAGYMPGGMDWSYIARAIAHPEQPAAPTTGQAASSMVGVKIYPASYEYGEQRQQGRRRAQALEMMKALKRELQGATSPEERQEILTRYKALFSELREGEEE
jgi:hypothetical protein